MLSTPRNKLVLMTLGATAALSVIVFTRPVTVLQLTSTDFQCISTVQLFELQWIHSVEKELWREAFQISGQELLLTTTQFKTFGAGTPSNADLIATNDGWLHYRIDRLLPHIDWITSSHVESTILTELGTWPLYQDFADYAEIQLQVIQAPRWHYFTQESCDDYFKKS